MRPRPFDQPEAAPASPGRGGDAAPYVRAGLAALAAGIALAMLAVASEKDAPQLGFLMWFRHEDRGVATEGVLLLAVFAASLALTVGAFAAGGRAPRFETAANVGVKIALLAAVAFMLAFPHLPQFENKSLTARAVLYPALAAIVPLMYAVRGMRGRYPALVDLCWTLALTVDIVGNDLHWYGNWKHWDDTVHFLNTLPILFVMLAGVLVLERRGVIRLGFWWAILFTVALYTALHGLWEMGEYLMDRYTGTELQPGGMEEATRNNISSMLGTLVAVALLWWWDNSDFLERGFVRPLASFAAQLRASPTRDW